MDKENKQNTLSEIQGTVEDIVFRNDSNGYTVLEVSCDYANITAVGTMPMVNVGEEIKMYGRWTSHASYGEQFSVDYYEHIMPSGVGAILRYLSSGAVKGIGAVTARKLVEAFGEKTLEVIEKEPNRLTEIKGITASKAEKMSQELQKVFGIREIMLYLERFQISPVESMRVWKSLGNETISLLNDNPYILCNEEIAVGFERADAMAAAMEKPCDDICRIRAGIIHIVTYNMHNGHTCLPEEKTVTVCANYLQLPAETIQSALSDMIVEGALVKENIGGVDFVFLPSMYNSESYAALRLKMMLQIPPEPIKGVAEALERFENEQHIEYAVLQKKAIEQAMSGGLLILTGGPGTGKTTTLNAIISLYMQCGLKVLLSAPTGRAAQRMSEVTGQEAKTIHRLLEVSWDKNERPTFQRNERNMLDCDVLVIDELSMIDVLLFESVLRALPLGCRLIMVGDSDQLPSVGAGNVLGDLIASKKVPTVQLTEIFRQSITSLIVTNAHKIVKGEMPEVRRTDGDFFFMSVPNKEKIISTILDLCKTRLPNTYNYSVFSEIQVLCPGRKGDLGVIELNKKIQQEVNPSQGKAYEINTAAYTFRLGDKVMQMKNNYDLPWIKDDGTDGSGIFNGDIGMIVDISRVSGSVCVRFDDRLVTYDTESLQDLDLAYATTVHKSQGNEFEAVIMPMYKGAPQLYYRNLLYTAVTRAKKMLILVGNTDTLKYMVNNNKKTKRYSALQHFLEKG
ncbi:MAG: ATP-dependent RecD-like DNA helicase [Acutalibacteraceae bacterium]